MIQNTISKTSDFLSDVRSEMSKVTWPTWMELRGQTLVVIIAVLVIAAFIYVVDLVLSNSIKLVLSWLG